METNDVTVLKPRRRTLDILLALGVFLFVGLVGTLIVCNLTYVSLDAFERVFGMRQIGSALTLSLVTSIISALLAAAIAVPVSYALSRGEHGALTAIDTMVDMLIVLPSLVLGVFLLVVFKQGSDYAYSEFPPVAAFGKSVAWLGRRLIYERAGIVVAQFFVCVGYAIRVLKAAFDGIDRRAEGVARTLGCTHLRAFLRVVLPQAKSGIVATVVMAWARTFGIFGPVMVFAGAVRGKTEVLPTAIYLEISVGNLENALAISLVMMAFSFTVLLIFRRIFAYNLLGTGSPRR